MEDWCSSLTQEVENFAAKIKIFNWVGFAGLVFITLLLVVRIIREIAEGQHLIVMQWPCLVIAFSTTVVILVAIIKLFRTRYKYKIELKTGKAILVGLYLLTALLQEILFINIMKTESVHLEGESEGCAPSSAITSLCVSFLISQSLYLVFAAIIVRTLYLQMIEMIKNEQKDGNVAI